MRTIISHTRLSEEPKVVEMLKKLPEGSKVPNLESSSIYLFLRIEDSHLVLLTDRGLGNIGSAPVEEYYPLNEVRYFREHGQPDVIELPSWTEFKPKRCIPLKDIERYSKMLKGVARCH
jgi:hypothetical protein